MQNPAVVVSLYLTMSTTEAQPAASEAFSVATVTFASSASTSGETFFAVRGNIWTILQHWMY